MQKKLIFKNNKLNHSLLFIFAFHCFIFLALQGGNSSLASDNSQSFSSTTSTNDQDKLKIICEVKRSIRLEDSPGMTATSMKIAQVLSLNEEFTVYEENDSSQKEVDEHVENPLKLPISVRLVYLEENNEKVVHVLANEEFIGTFKVHYHYGQQKIKPDEFQYHFIHHAFFQKLSKAVKKTVLFWKTIENMQYSIHIKCW